MRNAGTDAYRPEEFGHTIIIERSISAAVRGRAAAPGRPARGFQSRLFWAARALPPCGRPRARGRRMQPASRQPRATTRLRALTRALASPRGADGHVHAEAEGCGRARGGQQARGPAAPAGPLQHRRGQPHQRHDAGRQPQVPPLRHQQGTARAALVLAQTLARLRSRTHSHPGCLRAPLLRRTGTSFS
jgi:hypothetical protein